MSKDYIQRIAESKVKYHQNKTKMPYEEKFRIILELQKLDIEIRNSNPSRKKRRYNLSVWQIDEC